MIRAYRNPELFADADVAGELASTFGRIWYSCWYGGFLGGIVGVIFGSAVGAISGSFGTSIIGGTLGGITGSILGGIIGRDGGVGGLVLGGIAGGVAGGLLGGIGGGIGGGFLGGITGSIARGSINIPVSPWKALVSSLLFLAIVGVVWNVTGWEFLRAIAADHRVLAFVAFNVFADGVSLWETKWVLKRGETAKIPILIGLVMLDFALSGIIYLALPLALWPQILEFWDAWRFQGERPWMGLLFWTTFSTSFVFYAFVAAALLVRPLRGVAIGFGGIGGVFKIEEHPVRCLSVAMAIVMTAIFGGVAAWEVIRSLGTTVASVP